MHTDTHQDRVREYPRDDPRLGRRLRLDARSLPYMVERVPEQLRPARRSIEWRRSLAILDQGAIGSCTGFAGTGAMGTDPIDLPELGTDTYSQIEAYAYQLYSDATKADPYPGEWNVDGSGEDTGSDGLTVAKVLLARGSIGSFVHASTLGGLVDLLQVGPVMMGIAWYNAFFEPGADGHIDPRGWQDTGVAGGHEVEIVGVQLDQHQPSDLNRAVFKAANSWSPTWGPLGGYFLMNGRTYTILRHDIDLIQPRPAPAV